MHLTTRAGLWYCASGNQIGPRFLPLREGETMPRSGLVPTPEFAESLASIQTRKPARLFHILTILFSRRGVKPRAGSHARRGQAPSAAGGKDLA